MVDGPRDTAPEPTPAPSPAEVTQLLDRARGGEEVQAELLQVVYSELRRMARRFMNGQAAGHSLQPTDLVHECFLKLCRRDLDSYEGRGHFMAVAAQAMRSILVDHARHRGRKKRRPGERRVPLDEWVASFEGASDELLQVNEALNQLELASPRMAKVVELRFFGGYPHKEVATILGVSERTVEREWRFARAHLKRVLDG